MEKQALCVKAISYQEIVELKDLMERLVSWEELLSVLMAFFAFHSGPINKKQVIKEYYARGQIFQAFYEDYRRLVEVGDALVQKMVKAEKVGK
ncbi:hypothetical protein JZO66_03980 [Enterococcus sp. DIV0242_7C1]|uniref:Uncharacterized protein n=1 Tax=Candidatus Enterococcus dunnyi TaxID=1834192 RepID=A0A200JE78_9ENTE|nr:MULTISPECIES: hypothetical protein [unclassified Enterococcus]MBO0469693.1 hypothetical protein [Enterococcus sp. DIV0242_7C1]OUZ35010.1 hypothetical protein A5889_000485 [Enterococcus sp. 9D6_DIV0238]